MPRKRPGVTGPAWWISSAARDWWTDPETFDALLEAARTAPDSDLQLGMLALKVLGRKTRALDLTFGPIAPPGADEAEPRFPGRLAGDEAKPPAALVARIEAEDDERELRKITPPLPECGLC